MTAAHSLLTMTAALSLEPPTVWSSPLTLSILLLLHHRVLESEENSSHAVLRTFTNKLSICQHSLTSDILCERLFKSTVCANQGYECLIQPMAQNLNVKEMNHLPFPDLDVSLLLVTGYAHMWACVPFNIKSPAINQPFQENLSNFRCFSHHHFMLERAVFHLLHHR